MRWARASAVLSLAAWLRAAVSVAQIASPTGSIYGTVTDADGKALIASEVTLSGPGANQRANSDTRGDFRFLHLSPGAYDVGLERAGFETARRNVTVVPGKSVVLSITMTVIGAKEAVTVSAADSALDNRRIRTGATFGQKELESIPTTRDPWAVLRQVPGVLVDAVNVGGGAGARQLSVSGKGGGTNQNTYNVDGVAISLGSVSPLFFDFDSLSDIEVQTGGSDLSLATPGVAINLVTKRGTNQLKGSARALYTDGAGWDYGIEAGGAVWKDHLWLWSAVARNAYLGQTFVSPDGESIESRETLNHWNIKLNAQLVAANALTLSYTDFKRIQLGLGGPDLSEAATSDRIRPGRSYKMEDSHVLSPALFASVYLSYLAAVSTSTAKGGNGEQADLDEEFIWRHSSSSRRFRDAQHSAGLHSSAFFNTANLRHELKFGFGYRHTRSDSALAWPGDGLVGYVPISLAAITRPQDQKSEVGHYFGFLGDTVQAGRFTVNVGARFDYQQGRNLASAIPANPVFPELLPAVQIPEDSAHPLTRRQVQPRVGATYALGGGHPTLLRASYARFAEQLDSTDVRLTNVSSSIGYLYYGWTDANANGRVERDEVDLSDPQGSFGVDRNHPGAPYTVNRIAPNFEPPVTDEYILAIERQIAPGVSGSVAYTYRSFRNPEFLRWNGTGRSDYQYLGNATGTAADGRGFVLHFDERYYGLTTDPPVGLELGNRPDFRETYQGVELQLIKAFAHGWMARVSFAWNDWRQRVGPGAIFDPDNESPGTNASGPSVQGVGNARWQFNVSGMVTLPWRIEVGWNLFGREGFASPYFVEVVTNDTNGNRPAIQIGNATRYRTPDVYDLDLQVSKVFRIGSTVTVSPQVSCFNLLDKRTVLERDGFVGTYDPESSPAFAPNKHVNAPFDLMSRRVFRGGVRIAF